ncbi:MAG: glycosyltransferase family 4 protein [Pseudomonadota bacterium]
MRILVFSHYYPPEVNAPASRTSEHCRRWSDAGHDVTVVTCAPNHPRGEIYPGYKNKLFQSEMEDGVRVVRVWTYFAANEGFVRRTANYVSYMFSAALAAMPLKRPDIILSTSPQFFCGLTGLLAKWMRRTPWVFEVRDLWPESIVSVGAMRKGFAVRCLEGLESFAYKHADHIVSVTDAFVPHIADRSGATKVSVVKNGVNLDLFKKQGDAARTKARFGFEGRFIAAYVGTHGLAHGLDTVLDAARQLKNDDRIGFLLVGDGAERARLQARADEMALDNLLIVGQLPKSDMPAVWSATDASLIVLKKSDTFKKVLPSKMFEAMAMERPIILGVEGEAKALLEEANAGVAIRPEDARALAASVKELAERPDLAKRYGENGLTHVRTYFDRRKLAARYLDLLADNARTGNRDAAKAKFHKDGVRTVES